MISRTAIKAAADRAEKRSKLPVSAVLGAEIAIKCAKLQSPDTSQLPELYPPEQPKQPELHDDLPAIRAGNQTAIGIILTAFGIAILIAAPKGNASLLIPVLAAAPIMLVWHTRKSRGQSHG